MLPAEGQKALNSLSLLLSISQHVTSKEVQFPIMLQIETIYSFIQALAKHVPATKGFWPLNFPVSCDMLSGGKLRHEMMKTQTQIWMLRHTSRIGIIDR